AGGSNTGGEGADTDGGGGHAGEATDGPDDAGRADGGGCPPDAGCTCPPNTGTDVYVDPVAGSDAEDAGVRPTGVQTPPECRFATLTKGLSKVASGGRVVAISAALPVSFTTETFPLRIPAHTTLTTADGLPVPADFVITGTGTGSPSGSSRSAL